MSIILKNSIKNFVIFLYRLLQILRIILNIFIKKNDSINIYYGGARSGNIGGPLVKVNRLKTYFPEKFNFNILYTLSNANYLNNFSINILKANNYPIILNQNGVFYPSWYPNKWREKNKAMAEIYQKADYVFWQSNFCRHSADYFLGKRNLPGEVLFNAVDTKNKFYPIKTRNRKMTFLITGNFTKDVFYRIKNSLNGFIMARKIGSDFKLIIAGYLEKSILSYLKTIIRKYKLDDCVEFIGTYKQSEACRIYQLADAYLTTKYLDPCPNAVIEAMACGLPILYSNSGGIPELVGDKCGIGLDVPIDWQEIHVPDPTAIAESMNKIYYNLDEMSFESRKRALEKFDLKKWIQRHEYVFRKYLKK